jgi:hypothetical protein
MILNLQKKRRVRNADQKQLFVGASPGALRLHIRCIDAQLGDIGRVRYLSGPS